VSFDVFEEAELRSASGNSICDPGPEVASIFLAGTLACGAERLTRVASRDDVHQAVKLFPREGLEISPDRSWVQESRFHL
jgi:hypothetical protein